jgi:ribosome modulation factor
MNKYEEGQKAFEDGKFYDENPYPKGTDEHQRWLNGYMDADICESGETS